VRQTDIECLIRPRILTVKRDPVFIRRFIAAAVAFCLILAGVAVAVGDWVGVAGGTGLAVLMLLFLPVMKRYGPKQ